MSKGANLFDAYTGSGYSYTEQPSREDVKQACYAYRDVYGLGALREFMGYLGYKRVAEIPGENYQYVIDCLNAEMTTEQSGEDFVLPASPVMPPPRSARDAQKLENLKRWKAEEQRDRYNDGAYRYGKMDAMEDERDREALKLWRDRKRPRQLEARSLPAGSFDLPRRKKVVTEEPVEQKNWVEKRFGVLDV